MLKTLSSKLYDRILHKYFVRDLWFDLKMDAKREAIDYIKTHMREASPQPDRLALLTFAVEHAARDGLVCEFGVSAGKSVRHLSRFFPKVHGFDSFRGLPEDWIGTADRKGRFDLGGKLPKVPANVELHAGWFQDTLPGFLETHPGPLALLHLDADIYSSTKTVLDLVSDRIIPGTVIVFDEYHGYWNWQAHEFKAFQEWVAAHQARYDYIGFAVSGGGQVAVKITGKGH